jgi:hypothetical protein
VLGKSLILVPTASTSPRNETLLEPIGYQVS